MHQFLAYFIVLGLLSCSKCNSNEPGLKIMKLTDDTYIPVSSSIVEEKSGANFSLLCDLVSSKNNSNYYDFQVSWFKQSNDVRFWREFDTNQSQTNKSKKMYSILKPSEMNKAVKHFRPLRAEDGGKYYCVSLKYGLHEVVEVIVRNANNKPSFEEHLEPTYCSDSMFKCNNGVCIIPHYTCDGKPDCTDGSDESTTTCNGEPCKEKLQCDDGRCIPTSWCCDRHHDPNCTVNNRPKCCQILSTTYEELEYSSSTINQNSNGARYLFISIGALCILFVIVLFLLIVSRVMVMARKSNIDLARSRPEGRNFECIALRNQMIFVSNSSNTEGFSGQPNSSIDLIIDNCDVTDPLFANRDDQPPPYIDVVRAQSGTGRLNLNEPPPPYTSREMLNEMDNNNTVIGCNNSD